ncbi:hypothetical protein GWK47_014818 [Chionoecetes opilio]|uniref:Fibronectin type-III domain-containing protein n=1 Tax=Chionoecetes opilio TaxID=41210 RepID=A0A8J4XSZ9_CHIOP|nr:hypothetical protein GWK47_014818 [Chionoecetes opilio]
MLSRHKITKNPSQPEHVQWASPNSSTLSLWWQPPRHPNGVIDHYLVTLVLLYDVPKIPASLDFCKERKRGLLEVLRGGRCLVLLLLLEEGGARQGVGRGRT